MSLPLTLAAPETARLTRPDRRVAVRHAASRATECLAVAPAEGDVCPGWVRDISTAGVGLIVDRLFPAGTWLTVELESGPHELVLRLPARVVHALELPNDSWLHGCAFERDLTDDELSAFVA